MHRLLVGGWTATPPVVWAHVHRLDGEPVPGCFAHVCALPGDDARVPFDQPEVQGVRRDANYYRKYLGGTYGAVPHLG